MGRGVSVDHPWYAVQTQPRREEVAEARLGALGVAAFCPRYRRRVILNGYRREVVRPLFPGYLFAAFDRREAYRAVHYARGVRGVVSFGEEPVTVPDELLRCILARQRDGYVHLDPPSLRDGQRVEIVAGPFKGYTGLFRSQFSGADRVAILLEGLRLQARVVLEREMVREV